MAVFGFIIGFALLAYLTLYVMAMTYVVASFGGSGGGWGSVIMVVMLITGWYFLFANVPFTVSLA